jgi:hypothetical protein
MSFGYYEFLCWDDIIRHYWVKSFWNIFIDFLYVSWVYITSGTLLRVAKVSRTPAITGLYPAVYIALSGLVAILLGYACVLLFSTFNLIELGWLVAGMLSASFIYITKIIGDRINVFWLLRIYAFTSRWASGDIPEMDERIDYFADKIATTLQDNQHDEVIIVGHSVGTMLAVTIAARVVKKIDYQPNLQLNMVTLGECIPLLSLLPKANAMRKDLACLSATETLYWVDYTSPADGACFPLVDPVKVSLPPEKIKNNPYLFSARFHTLYTPANYQSIRRNFIKCISYT